jgi:hypothetical protein
MSPKSIKRKLRPIFLIVSLLLFVALVIATARGFTVRDGVQWDPAVVYGTNGAGAKISTYEICSARGVVCFCISVDHWNSNDVGRRPGWFYYNFRPDSLFTEPTPHDRTNIQFAGFQFYHGVFPNQVASLQDHTVYSVIFPLWPFLIFTAAFPIAWLYRRRRASRLPNRPAGTIDYDTPRETPPVQPSGRGVATTLRSRVHALGAKLLGLRGNCRQPTSKSS